MCFDQDAVKLNQLQNLLHDALIATNHVQSCAIIRRKDVTLRASSVGFNVSYVLFAAGVCVYMYNVVETMLCVFCRVDGRFCDGHVSGPSCDLVKVMKTLHVCGVLVTPGSDPDTGRCFQKPTTDA